MDRGRSQIMPVLGRLPMVEERRRAMVPALADLLHGVCRALGIPEWRGMAGRPLSLP